MFGTASHIRPQVPADVSTSPEIGTKAVPSCHNIHLSVYSIRTPLAAIKGITQRFYAIESAGWSADRPLYAHWKMVPRIVRPLFLHRLLHPERRVVVPNAQLLPVEDILP
jgi:hypothetical protein